MRAAGIPARVVTGYQGGDVQSLRRLLDRAPERCTCLGRDLGRRARLGAHRSDRGDLAGARGARLEHGARGGRAARPAAGIGARRGSPNAACGSMPCASCGASESCNSIRLAGRAAAAAAHPRARRAKARRWCWRPRLALAFAWLTWQVRRELQPRRRIPCAAPTSGCAASWPPSGWRAKPHEGAEDYAARVARAAPRSRRARHAAVPALFAAALRAPRERARAGFVPRCAHFSRARHAVPAERGCVAPGRSVSGRQILAGLQSDLGPALFGQARLTRVGARYTSSPA